MSEGTIPIKKAIPIIAVTWILSLLSTLAIVYFAPSATIGTNQIADSAIITTKLADGSVTSAKILDGTITAVDMADGSVIAVKVADGAITTTKIADGSITSAKIADNAIVTVKLADGSVTSAKILDGSVTAADLATGAVTTMKIADGAVTTNTIADYAVTNLKLAPYAIPYNVTHSRIGATTTSAIFEDMPDMSMPITLSRNSTLIITFSAVAYVMATGNVLYVRAMVDTTQAEPVIDIQLTASTVPGAYSYTFYKQNVGSGTYTIKIQWRVSGEGKVWDRTLTVIALPA